MSILDIFKKKEAPEVIHQVVLVEVPINEVGMHLATWHDHAWRPSSPLIFKRRTSAVTAIGSELEGSFKTVWPVRWKLEVTRFYENALLQSKVTGFFKGIETITIEERFNGIKLEYNLTYEIGNPINAMLWSVMVEEKFLKEIRTSLDAFKKYCEKKAQ